MRQKGGYRTCFLFAALSLSYQCVGGVSYPKRAVIILFYFSLERSFK